MGVKIRYLPVDERPRERLRTQGVDSLSSIELLAILLSSGTLEKSALDLASELLATFQNLRTLSDAPLEELMAIKGVGEAKAIKLKAALGLASRLLPYPATPREELSHPRLVYEKIRYEMEKETTEVLMVLLLNTRGYLFHREIIAKGTISDLLVHPREVFYPAIRRKASSLILAHNHVSGDPEPSQADLMITHSLVAAGQVIGIAIIDHVIVGNNSYVSLVERGMISRSDL